MKERLRTLKEVAEIVRQEPHRVIHLCECRVVVPKIGADGRGSVRRFSRDDIFRIRLGLTLQDSGLSVSQIKPVMVQLARLRKSRHIRAFSLPEDFDTVDLIQALGTPEDSVFVCVTPPNDIAFITPRLDGPLDYVVEIRKLDEVLHSWVSVVANLTSIAKGLHRVCDD